MQKGLCYFPRAASYCGKKNKTFRVSSERVCVCERERERVNEERPSFFFCFWPPLTKLEPTNELQNNLNWLPSAAATAAQLLMCVRVSKSKKCLLTSLRGRRVFAFFVLTPLPQRQYDSSVTPLHHLKWRLWSAVWSAVISCQGFGSHFWCQSRISIFWLRRHLISLLFPVFNPSQLILGFWFFPWWHHSL